MATPNSSSAIVGNCATCGHGSAVSLRDIRRNIEGQPELEAAFERPLSRAAQIRSQEQHQRGYKLYSFHAPEVECISKARLRRRMSSASRPRSSPPTTAPRAASSCCMPKRCRATYDGHTLGDIISSTETLTGRPIERAYVDKGYRCRKTENARRVFISGQKRGVFGVIKRELRRRSAIEPVVVT